MKLLILAALCVAAYADNRIVGGTNAYAGQFPHMVAVRHSETFICGGALIGPQWVLTSGECVWEYPGTEFAYSVYAGGLSILSGSNPGRVSLSVDAVYPHPKFRTRDTLYYFNIGLIHLTTAAPMSSLISTALLPISGSQVDPGTVAELSGWGGTNSKVVPYLQWAPMKTIAIEACTTAVGGGHDFTPAQICSASSPSLPSACWYDHGGPLVTKVVGTGTTVIGVTAYAGCLDPTHPTIYTSVGFKEHRDWIKQVSGI